MTKATLRDLQSREWIGNVRELESIVERGVIISRGATLQLGDDGTPVPGQGPALGEGPRTLAQVEREAIVAMLARTGWRVEGAAGAAVLLGINPST